MTPTPAPRRLGAWAATAGLLALAAWVRVGWFPVGTRHVFDGHEADYLTLFQGTWTGGWSTRVVPVLGLLTRGLGLVSQDPRVLLAVPLLASLASILALVRLVGQRAGSATGFLAGLLLALHGNHAFWSSSAYHVMVPFGLAMSGLALLTLPTGAGPLLSAVLFGLGAAMRPELLALLLPGWLLWPEAAGSAPGSLGRRLAWTVAVLGVAGIAAAPVLLGTGLPPGVGATVPRALVANLSFTAYLAPWSGGPPLALAVALAGVAAGGFPRPAAAWGLAVLVTILGVAGFSDAGFRHYLVADAGLCALSALGVRTLVRGLPSRAGPLLGGCLAAAATLLTLSALLGDTCEVARLYYAPPSEVASLAIEAPPTRDDAPFEGCRWVSDEPPLPGQEAPSHLDLVDRAGCILWGEEYPHRTWTSRSLRDRGLRMHALYDLEPLAVRSWPEDPGRPVRLVWRLRFPTESGTGGGEAPPAEGSP